jgi:hypothetical protein
MWGMMCGPPTVGEQETPHTNEAWWTSQVVCAKVEEVSEGGEGNECERFYKFVGDKGIERWMKSTRLSLTGPPDLGVTLNGTITAFTEVRQPYWAVQPHSWITYHAFVVLEIDHGALFVLCERKTDMLELVVGEVGIPLAFMKAFRAVGPGRNPSRCVEEPRRMITTRITVRQLLGWLDGPVEERWKPYDLLKANCQHFVADLQSFLLEPSSPDHHADNPLQGQPREAFQDRTFVLRAVTANPRTLKYLPDIFRRDKQVVMTAVTQDGAALRYAPETLRCDHDVCMIAVRQNGYCLPYVHPLIRQDRRLVLAAVQQNGYVLCYCAEEHRLDREVVLTAVQQEGYALRYVAGKLKKDPEVLLAAGLRNPVALARATFLF